MRQRQREPLDEIILVEVSETLPQAKPGETLPQVAWDEELPQAVPDDEKPQKPSLKTRWERLRSRLPRFSDETQRKAGKNLLRFFVLILIVTLVARGTAGATLPLVNTTRPSSGEIIQKVRGTGTVKTSGSQLVDVPEGLTVKQLDASVGESVSAGDPLAKFDTDEIAEQLQRQTTSLDEMRLKLQQLQRGTPYDGSSLESAQRTLARAQQDYDSTKTQGETSVANAQQALALAEAAAQQALNTANSHTDKTTPEYQAAYTDWQAKAEDVTAKKEALTQAQTQADAALLGAARALEDAQAALSSAQTSDTQARQQAGDTTAQNNLEAETLKLDIEAQQEKVDALQALLNAGGQLYAAGDGTVQELPQSGTKTGETSTFRVSDASGGYEAELWLDKGQAEKLSPGDSCEVTLSGGSMYYQPTATGQILSVSEAGEDGRVKVTIRLPEGDWKAGQTVEAQVVLDRQTHAMCVPLSALHSASDGYYVLVLQEQNTVLGLEYVAAKVPVTVKTQNDQTAAIEGAISDRDNIITSGNKAIQPGDKVRVSS